MSFFRIYIYLKLKFFFLSIFNKVSSPEEKIKSLLNQYTKKKNSILTGQLRVGFFLVIKYLKQKYPQKKEIIVSSYNLAEMINICKNLNLKVKFTKLNENIFLDADDLKKKINQKTLAVLVTNIFNTSKNIKSIKSVCKKFNVPLIEDNAIYFGNYTDIKGKKVFSGSYGDYSLHSFNIMKNISGMYGGSVSSDDEKFINYSKNELTKFQKFPFIKYSIQCVIYFILKIISLKYIYKLFFFNFLKKTYKKKNKYILKLIYPSLKFKKQNFESNFLTKLNNLSSQMIWYQLNDKNNIALNHIIRKNNNIYYDKLFKKFNIKELRTIKMKEPNYQNFNDFPIIVEDKAKLILYLLDNGIETKTIQYLDCHKIFEKNTKGLDNYENRVLCLPNHIKIKKSYIDYIVSKIYYFYKYKSKNKINMSM